MQLSGRRWVAAALTAVLAGSGLVAGSAQAFPPTNAYALGGYSHESITQHVMTDLATEFFKATRSTRSMWEARKEVVEADAAVDDDQKHSALHFDGENFEGGQLRLQNLRSLTVQRLRADQPAKAREALGQALHTLQDFYSHTNWIELGNSRPNPALGRPGQTLGSVARLYEATCDGSDLLTDKLTSGYYSGEDRVPVVRGKCRHGGPFDHGPGDGGINKDMVDSTFSPHHDLHYEAVHVAELATAQFLRDIKDDVTEPQLRSLFGLGPSLAIAIDNSSSMIDDQAKVAAQVNRIVRSRIGTDREPVSYVLVPFNDPVVGPVQKTDDPDTFLRAISSLPHRDTPTCPSLSMSGLLQAIQASSEGGEVYVITDADPLDPHLQYEATMEAKTKKIRVTPITFGRCETPLAKAAATGEKTVTTEQAAPAETDKPKADKARARELIRKAKAQEAARAKARRSTAAKPNATKPSTTESTTVTKAGLGPTAPPAFTAYKTVANGTGGRMFALNSDEVDKIADLADQWTDDDTVSVLNADLILDRTATPFPFPVDSTMRRLYVYLEGLQDYPQRATLTRPDGVEIRPGQPGVEYPVSESEDRRMVVAIDQPMVGEWQLRVWGLGPVWATPASVRVTADSDLDLDNFAFVPPEVLDTENVHEYSGQADQTPPAGPVAVTAHLTADVASASFEFRSPEGVTQNTFGLPRSGTDYLGAATLPTADSVFYVRGTDAGGKAFQRTVAAPVQKPNPNLVVTPAPAQRLLPNTTVTRSVTVKNLGPTSSFVIRQNSDQPYADGGYEYGQYFELGAGQSGRIDYTVTVPDDVVAGTEATLTYSVRDLEDATNVARAEVTLPVGPNLDQTPPVVQATTTPEPGPNGRFDGSTDVTVTLDAADAACVKSVTYQVTYEDTREPETVVANRGAVIPVDGEGTTTIRYKATDENGNESAYQTLDVTIESPPAGQIVSTTPDGDAVRVQTTRRGQKATVVFPGRAGQQVSAVMREATFPPGRAMPWSLIGPNGLVRRSDIVCYYNCFIEPVTLPDDGDYRLVLDPVRDDVGSAEVRIYDVPEIPVVPTTLDGAAHRVTIAKPGQRAALSFTGRAGQRVTVVPSDHTFVNVDARFVFELPSGETMTAFGGLDGAGGSGGEYRPVELPDDGPYLMWVDPDYASTGAVTVQLYDTADDLSVQLEPDADPVTLQTTTPGQRAQVTFRGEVGQRLSLALTDTSYVTTSFGIYDPYGRLWSAVSCSNGACRAALPVIRTAGEYEVRYGGSWRHPVGFTAQLFDVSTDVTATAVIDGPPTTVTTLPGQQAAVSFAAEAGQVITLTTSLPFGDAVLRDPDGADVVSGFCFFGCTFPDITLPKTGRYTLAMDPFDNVAGPITVEVIDASPHDPGHPQ